MSTQNKTHQAASLLEKGTSLKVSTRPTPNPSPNDLLIEVHALALNPVDHHQRDTGLFIQEYPAIIGCDVAGIIIAAGASTRESLKPGTRVTALASCFFNPGADYGAFQERVLVSEETVSILPDTYSFVEGAVFPLAAVTSWNGWVWAGLKPNGTVSAKGEGVFVWGASSSIGALAVQEAKGMGLTVYATASARHHEYIRGLGASRVFDYKDVDVLDQIVKAAGEDGVRVRIGYLATGDQQLAADVLDALRGDWGVEGVKSKLAIAPILEEGVKVSDEIDFAFVYPPQDRGEMKESQRAIFVDWLEDALASKQVVASPHIKVIKGGLKSVNGALDELKAGVSCLKIVVEL